MFSIIVGFPKLEDANNIKNLLSRGGYQAEACTTGSQIVSRANDLDEGIVICGYRFSDMHFSELDSYLPKGFEMLLIASPEKLEYCQDNNIVCLPMPVRSHDLLNTIQMMSYRYQRRMKKEREERQPKERSQEEKEVIQRAKLVLMHRNHMTEEEAHRYLQKHSMDSGTKMVEMAEMVLKMFTEE